MQKTVTVTSSTGSSHTAALPSTPAAENVWSFDFDLDLTTPFDPAAIRSATMYSPQPAPQPAPQSANHSANHSANQSASAPETFPLGMSEARRKARAELVREAFDCGNY